MHLDKHDRTRRVAVSTKWRGGTEVQIAKKLAVIVITRCRWTMTVFNQSLHHHTVLSGTYQLEEFAKERLAIAHSPERAICEFPVKIPIKPLHTPVIFCKTVAR